MSSRKTRQLGWQLDTALELCGREIILQLLGLYSMHNASSRASQDAAMITDEVLEDYISAVSTKIWPLHL